MGLSTIGNNTSCTIGEHLRCQLLTSKARRRSTRRSRRARATPGIRILKIQTWIYNFINIYIVQYI